MTVPSDRDQRRGIRRLMLLRALDGAAALGPACHRDVPGVDGVVLTAFVAHAGWIILSDSGPNGDRLEGLHATLGEGPRTDVVATGRLVSYADLTHAQAFVRWPRFAAQALASGIRAVSAFPVQLDVHTVGVLSVYRATAGPLSDADHQRVNWYARTASVLLHATAHVTGAGAVSMPLLGNAGE
ncbi:GAF domain-containing protein, partial [Micromonosporaceae bacterium Da 78-11]